MQLDVDLDPDLDIDGVMDECRASHRKETAKKTVEVNARPTDLGIEVRLGWEKGGFVYSSVP